MSTNNTTNPFEAINSIVDALSTEITEETPGFRLYEDIDTSKIDLDSLEVSKFIFTKLLEKGYRVEVVEDLDITDVTSDERFTIVIKNANSNVEFKYSLNKFREQLLDYDFEPDTFIINIIKRIDGIKGNEELKELKDDILTYLSYAIHYKELFRYNYSTIGWDRATFDNKTRIFRYNHIISNNVDIKGLIKEKYRELYSPSVDILNEGLEENWRSFTIHLMNNHVYDSLLFSVGISGLIRQILTFTKETNLNINIMGQPGSGKSTIGHYILSFFGNPTLLEGASIDTENAAERIRAERPVLPYVLDERMLRFYNDSENKQKTELLLEVFREYEGKEKERLGKQYENSVGQRIYGPIISSSVESMLETLLQTGEDLGQYRRFIEFNIGKAEDEILFNAEEAVRAEELANSSYGYGVKYIAEYMLYRFKTDDNYFNNQFRDITAFVNEKIIKEQELQKMRGLTSSSMRFALVILSYRVLRESILYSLYAEIIKRKEIISSADIQKKISILEKCEHKQDIIEEIKQFDMSFEELLRLENKQVTGYRLIVNHEERILCLLINNLVEKMAQVKKKNITKDTLMKYFIKNYREYPEYFCSEAKKFDATKHIFVYEDKTDNITIQMPRAYKLDEVLFNSELLTPEEILENINVNNENNLEINSTWEIVYKTSGKIFKKGVKDKSIVFIPSKKGSNKLKTYNPNKQTTFDILVLKKGDFEEDSESKEEDTHE